MSVTAVPLRPLGKGTMLKFWIGTAIAVAGGIGLAWLGTSPMQFTKADKGVRYRVYNAGTGSPMGSEDIAFVHIEMRGPRGQVIQSSRDILNTDSRPPRVNAPQLARRDDFVGPLAPLKPLLVEGGVYQMFVPASTVFEDALPADLNAGDALEYRLQVVRIERGALPRLEAAQRERVQRQAFEQQMRQELMQQGPGPASPTGPGAPARIAPAPTAPAPTAPAPTAPAPAPAPAAPRPTGR